MRRHGLDGGWRSCISLFSTCVGDQPLRVVRVEGDEPDHREHHERDRGLLLRREAVEPADEALREARREHEGAAPAAAAAGHAAPALHEDQDPAGEEDDGQEERVDVALHGRRERGVRDVLERPCRHCFRHFVVKLPDYAVENVWRRRWSRCWRRPGDRCGLVRSKNSDR